MRAVYAALYRVSITFRTVKGNHRYMKDRVLSGVTLVAFFMAIVVFNRSFPLALNIAIAFISALAVFEVIKALGLSDRWYITVPSMTAAVLVQFCEFQQANIFIYSAFTACIFRYKWGTSSSGC